MAEPLKNQFSPAFFAAFCEALQSQIPDFDEAKFQAEIFDADWEQRELKERMRHTTLVWGRYMPNAFPAAAKIVRGMTRHLLDVPSLEDSFAWVVLPDYIEVFGQDHFEEAVKTMEIVTQLMSCEFAVRPFLIRYPTEMMAQMLAWSRHESHHVRRFATEGMRSRLPWGMAVPALKSNPSLILPILENLKQDPADWVRLSVSNNLNDISKDHPDLAKKLAQSWKGLSPATDKLVKHGLRTLLKKGDPEALLIIGIADASGLEVQHFYIENPELTLGENLWFSFALANVGPAAKAFRLEYGVYYMKANGTLSRKVFKLTEGELAAGASREFRRKQHFKPISTRKYHAGEHRLSIIVNGEELVEGELSLQLE